MIRVGAGKVGVSFPSSPVWLEESQARGLVADAPLWVVRWQGRVILCRTCAQAMALVEELARAQETEIE